VKVFIDSNVPMYVAGKEHPNRKPAIGFLESLRKGRVDACTNTEVLQEILYRYSALGRRDLAREVYDLFVEMCPSVLSVTPADADRARDLLNELEGILARDSVHAAVMLNHVIDWIATFDIPGIRRVELG
jgi:predicted nucleic acid-binding protein